MKKQMFLPVVKFRSTNIKDCEMFWGNETLFRLFLKMSMKPVGTLESGMCNVRTTSMSTGSIEVSRREYVTSICHDLANQDSQGYFKTKVPGWQTALNLA